MSNLIHFAGLVGPQAGPRGPLYGRGLSSFCSENRSPLTDSERANIRLKNLQVNERHQFIPVPVPESDTFTSFIEDQLAKIDNLSESDLNAMVVRTLDTFAR